VSGATPGGTTPGGTTPPGSLGKKAGFVRAARESDAPGLARIQVASWRASLGGLVPDEILAELGSTEAEEQFAERWRDAITNPPSSRHKVHVAVQPDAGGDVSGGTASMAPVGFASAGPATDDDKWPATDAELYELHVLPSADDEGHGPRLLAAVADTLAEDGFRSACTWALSGDSPRLSFLETAGWAPDGAHSNLDMGVKVHVVRLHTLLSPES
jgi:ribosomal protein S18 acetylase RimI-like enzyme